jgi:hypothetical protein
MARAAFLGKKAEVSKELDGLEIGVNQFGVISSNLSVEEMNAFLNKNVFDKKLKNNLSSEMSGDYDSLDEDFDDDEDDFDDDEDDAFDDFDDDYDDDDLEGMDFEDDDSVADEDTDDDFDDDVEEEDDEE